ncbi:response regulator [bacterium]|nr:response regulator [bacterium]
MVKRPDILVIDDEMEICGFLKDLLTAEGYTVATATDPKEGLRIVEQSRPDLVLLDLKMPGMSGIDVLRRIKKIDEGMAVIIITGFGSMDTARAAMRLDAFDYITKPFDLAHVKAVVKDALARKITGLVGQLKSRDGLLSKKELTFLDSLEKCRPEGACVWEVAVRGFLLGDIQFLLDWTEQPGIPHKDKKNLARVTQILNNMTKRLRQK